MKTPRITSILKGAAARADLSSKGLSKEMGIPYQTLRYRFKNPSTWRFYEWGSLLKHLPLTEEELTEIRKEVRNC